MSTKDGYLQLHHNASNQYYEQIMRKTTKENVNAQKITMEE